MKVLAGKRGQRGAALILFMAGMIVIIGMAGLALDLGHAYLNKTRLQNVLDAAALSGAKVLNDTTDASQATAAALETFNQNLSGELQTADLTPIVELSNTLLPFVPGSANPRYVRVKVTTFPMTVWFARVLPGIGTTQTIGGSAVAGPSPPLSDACNIAPFLICADPTDTDCSDGSCYGYEMGGESEVVMKTGARTGNEGWNVGPGNFQVLALDGCGSGADCVRRELAGSYAGCAGPGETVTTEPGNNVGPIAQGMNTRFGMYQGGGLTQDQYPPDVVTHYEVATVDGVDVNQFWWQDYLDRVSSGDLNHPEPTGVLNRRVMSAPVGVCTTEATGRSTVQVLGLLCMFLTRPATQHSGDQEVYAQFIGRCPAVGHIGENPDTGSGTPVTYKIILYKDPDSQDS